MSLKYNNTDLYIKNISYQAERLSDGLAFFDFLDPTQQIYITRELKNFPHLYYRFFGGHEQCERKMLCISTYDIKDDIPWPISLCTAKVGYKFNHREVLGSVMSLGVKRETIGDIIIDDTSVQIVATEPIAKYIVLNLRKIRNRKVDFTLQDISNIQVKEIEFKEEHINVNSLRLDGVISAAYGISRDNAAEIIKKNGVKLNHLPISKVSKNVTKGDLISVRGKGRFILDDVVGITRKGRNKVLIKKYV